MADRYWVGDGGNWSDDDNHWATSSGGSPGNGNKPTTSDNVFFDANSFSSDYQRVTIDEDAYCLKMDWTGVTNAPILKKDGGTDPTITVSGELLLNSSMSFDNNYTPRFLFDSSSDVNINFADHTLRSRVYCSGSGKKTLTAGFTLAGYSPASGLVIYSPFDFNNQDVTIRHLQISTEDEVWFGSGTITLTGHRTTSSPTLTIDEDATIHAETSTIYFYDTRTSGSQATTGLYFANHEMNNLKIYSSNIYSGNTVDLLISPDAHGGFSPSFPSVTFNEIIIEEFVGTIFFQNGKTFNVSSISGGGTSSVTTTIKSDSDGDRFTISDSSGTNNFDYLDIKDCCVTGGANFNAGLNSVNSGNNKGWSWFTDTSNALNKDGNYATFASPTNGQLNVSVSKDGGITFQDTKTQTFSSDVQAQSFGGASVKWGTTWTGADVDDESFVIKVWGDDPDFYQTFQDFGFDKSPTQFPSDKVVNGITVLIWGYYDSGTFYIDHVSCSIHWGNTTIKSPAGAIAYATDGRKNGEAAGEGTGVLVFRDQQKKWIAVDTGQEVQS